MSNFGARPHYWQKYKFKIREYWDVYTIRKKIMNKEFIEQLRKVLKEQLASMSERERKILDMRFGLSDGNTHTLEEVGKVFGITRERIRQIETKTIEKLKVGGWLVDK